VPADGEHLVARPQPLRLGVAAFPHRHDVALVADHLQLPAVLHLIDRRRRDEIGVRIIEAHHRLRDDAEHLADGRRLHHLPPRFAEVGL
jgi:hypothetical protein